MPLPSSGALSMNDIAGEFGGSTPHSLSEYYASGALVLSGTSGTYGAVPSSGTISIQNFYGTANATPTGTYTTNNTSVLFTGNMSTGPDYSVRRTPPSSGWAPPATEVPADNASWLYDNSTGYQTTLSYWSSYVTVASYLLTSNINTVTITAWGGGGGSGGAWATSANSPGGAGGYATTVLSRSSGHFSTNDWIHVVAGHGGRGAAALWYGGYGGGASFAWKTNSNISALSTYNKLLGVSSSNIVLCAGGGGGGGATNIYSGGGTGGGGAGGWHSSGNNHTGQISGSGAGAGSGGSAAHGSQSVGPNANLGAGAAGGMVGYYSGSLVYMPEASARNLIITVKQDITLAGYQDLSSFTWVAGGGGGVFMGACGSRSIGSGYGNTGRGGGGGANKVYLGNGSTGTGGVTHVPINPTGSVGYGGTGSYGNNGGGNPNKSGNNGFGGRVVVILA